MDGPKTPNPPAVPPARSPARRNRALPKPKAEATILMNCRNRFTALGMPVSVKIG